MRMLKRTVTLMLTMVLLLLSVTAAWASNPFAGIQGPTLAKRDGAWYLVKNGAVSPSTMLFKFNDQWYYIKDGQMAADTTTLIKHSGSWYYVYKGRVATEATTLVKFNDQWYYVKNGKVASDTTTLVKYSGSWYYVYKGRVASETTTLVQFNDQWYYVKNGKVASNTTGLVKHEGSWYYICKGRWAKEADTLVKHSGSWYYVRNGKVSFDTTGLVKYAGSTWYVKDGIAQTNTTTLVELEGSRYYIENGKWSQKTFLLDFEGQTYNVKDGIATVKTNGKIIYLTFDDGPGPHTEKLLGVLKKYNVKATFFVCNTGYTHLFDDIVADGHTIAIHSKTHKYSQIYSSDSAFYEDLYFMQDLIYEKTGVKTFVTRFPGGSSNSISRHYSSGIMTRLTKSIQEKGFRYFDWNVDSKDAGGTKTASGVAGNVIGTIRGSSKTHFYVLQHDIHGFSVNGVEQIIQWGLRNGYTFKAITVDSPVCHHGVRN